MKIKINYNNDDLWCLDSKERIEIDEKYVEINEDYQGDVFVKTYKYECLDNLIEEHLDRYEKSPEIFEEVL